MNEHSIELFGQKLSYPTTWQGVSAVLGVCAAVVLLSYFLDSSKIRAIGEAVANVSSSKDVALADANETIQHQATEIEDLTNLVEKLKKSNGRLSQQDSELYNKVLSNRVATTVSLKRFIETGNNLQGKNESLQDICPECVSKNKSFTFNADVTNELKQKLNKLNDQKTLLRPIRS